MSDVDFAEQNDDDFDAELNEAREQQDAPVEDDADDGQTDDADADEPAKV